MDGLGRLDRPSRVEDFSREIAGLPAQVLSELGPCTCRCHGMKMEHWATPLRFFKSSGLPSQWMLFFFKILSKSYSLQFRS